MPQQLCVIIKVEVAWAHVAQINMHGIHEISLYTMRTKRDEQKKENICKKELYGNLDYQMLYKRIYVFFLGKIIEPCREEYYFKYSV